MVADLPGRHLGEHFGTLGEGVTSPPLFFMFVTFLLHHLLGRLKYLFLREDTKGISAVSLLRALPLLHAFMEAGARQGVLLSYRLEAAALAMCAERPSLVAGRVQDAAAMFAVHIGACFKVLRALVREDRQEQGARGGRRYPKTGHLRRRFNAADWVLLRRTMALLEMPDITTKVAQ